GAAGNVLANCFPRDLAHANLITAIAYADSGYTRISAFKEPGSRAHRAGYVSSAHGVAAVVMLWWDRLDECANRRLVRPLITKRVAGVARTGALDGQQMRELSGTLVKVRAILRNRHAAGLIRRRQPHHGHLFA